VQIGDPMLTTGALMGFGAADFTTEQTQSRLITNVSLALPERLGFEVQPTLYMSCGVVFQKPL
jgi:hypothetical protein